MSQRDTFLDQLRIAAPCNAAWDEMAGDDRVRHCDECRLDVYDLSGMSRREAEALVVEREGRLCVRLHRRADGTVLTRDCRVGLRRLRRAAVLAATRAAALVGLLLGAASGCTRKPAGQKPFPEVEQPRPQPEDCVMGIVAPTHAVTGRPAPIEMGEAVAPTPPPDRDPATTER